MKRSVKEIEEQVDQLYTRIEESGRRSAQDLWNKVYAKGDTLWHRLILMRAYEEGIWGDVTNYEKCRGIVHILTILELD